MHCCRHEKLLQESIRITFSLLGVTLYAAVFVLFFLAMMWLPVFTDFNTI